MLLSVIIVNYNTKYFLEQCLCSLKKALKGIEGETIVVDNHSVDGSLAYLQAAFPELIFMANEENLGFARANNLALEKAQGDFILFLNPDTILSEDCIRQSIAFIQKNPSAGALGLRMIDGAGHFLPESKRGFPYPGAAFCKLFGLAALFPKSKFFSSYYLGHLSANEIHRAEVISGAFMLVRKKILETTGGFDEMFFMYGEDIDLSYRIQQAGYSNWYLGTETIIHFKGESTPRNAGYIKWFYTAMEQFIRKYFHGKTSWFYIQLIHGGMRLRRLAAKWQIRMAPHIPSQNAAKKYALLGDQQTIRQLRPGLAASGKSVTDKIPGADELIYCEGPDFSFQEIIRHIQHENHVLNHKFHACHSHSIVGSDSKNRMGEAIAL